MLRQVRRHSRSALACNQSSHIEIDPEQILGMKDFVLHDAMMAIEVPPALYHSNVV